MAATPQRTETETEAETETMPSRLEARRLQHKHDTRIEIQRIARAHMAAGTDVGSLSLRAIAREMGVSPAALYGYFETKDDLIVALVAAAFDSLTDALASASSRGGPRKRLVAMALAYRQWANEHRLDFQMLFGAPIPGFVAPEEGPTVMAARRFGEVVFGAVVAAWPGDGQPDPHAITDFYVRYLARLHGMVSLERGGYLATLVADSTALHRRDVQSLIDELDTI